MRPSTLTSVLCWVFVLFCVWCPSALALQKLNVIHVAGTKGKVGLVSSSCHDHSFSSSLRKCMGVVMPRLVRHVHTFPTVTLTCALGGCTEQFRHVSCCLSGLIWLHQTYCLMYVCAAGLNLCHDRQHAEVSRLQHRAVHITTLV
jgi:hypothetical protein